MKTIYIREKRSGNFEFASRENATLKFKTKKEFKQWFEELRYGRLIKATYRFSQTYFEKYDFDAAWKRAKELF